VNYNIKAIETKLMGFTFRSRLEARWAAFFELCGWQWDYEPTDFNGWIPDFAIYGRNPIYVEVKPVIKLPQEVADKIDSSGCQNEVLILGQTFPVPNAKVNFTSTQSHALGWLREVYDCHCGDCVGDCKKEKCQGCHGVLCRRHFFWDEASFGPYFLDPQRANDIAAQKLKYDFSHSEGGYHYRMSGYYDGSPPGYYCLDDDPKQDAMELWGNAHAMTRWMAT
jgi:hypothetical protein